MHSLKTKFRKRLGMQKHRATASSLGADKVPVCKVDERVDDERHHHADHAKRADVDLFDAALVSERARPIKAVEKRVLFAEAFLRPLDKGLLFLGNVGHRCARVGVRESASTACSRGVPNRRTCI